VGTWWPLVAIVLLFLVAQGAIVLLALLLAAPMLGRAVASGLADIEDAREGARRVVKPAPPVARATAPARHAPPPAVPRSGWLDDSTQRLARVPADDDTVVRRLR